MSKKEKAHNASYIPLTDQAETIHSINSFGFNTFVEAEKAREERRQSNMFKREDVGDQSTAYFRVVDYKGDLNEEMKSAAQKMFDQAKQVLHDSESQAEELKKAAFNQGYEEGYADGMNRGLEEAKNSVRGIVDVFEQGIDDLSGLRKEVYHKSEGEIIELVLMIARKVIHAEILINREVILNVIKAAISNVLQKEKMVIRINPEDFDFAVSCKPDLQAYVEDLKNVVMEKDDTIERGGCIVITEAGKVEAQIDQSFTEVEEILRKAYQNEGL